MGIVKPLKYRAVLFDLDGTLLNTLQDIATSYNNALRRFSFPEHELEAYRYFVGSGMEELAKRALPEDHRDTDTVARMVATMTEEYQQHCFDTTYVYPGVTELLDALTTKGIKIAILSNKGAEFTKLTVSRLLSRWSFAAVVGASADLPKKPDPTGARQVAQKLELNPAEFLYVGDSDIDMKTATGAGMYPVGALWGFRTAEELTANGAKTLIKRPKELLKLL